MTDVLTAVGSNAELGWLAGIMTAVFLFFFFGWAAWAWWPGNRRLMESASRMPLDEDDGLQGGGL